MCFDLHGDFVEGFEVKYFYVVAASMHVYRRLRQVNSDCLEIYKFPLSWSEDLSFEGCGIALPKLSTEEAYFYRWVNEYVSLLGMGGQVELRYVDTGALLR